MHVLRVWEVFRHNAEGRDSDLDRTATAKAAACGAAAQLVTTTSRSRNTQKVRSPRRSGGGTCGLCRGSGRDCWGIITVLVRRLLVLPPPPCSLVLLPRPGLLVRPKSS